MIIDLKDGNKGFLGILKDTVVIELLDGGVSFYKDTVLSIWGDKDNLLDSNYISYGSCKAYFNKYNCLVVQDDTDSNIVLTYAMVSLLHSGYN